jgi:hypothetical protein
MSGPFKDRSFQTKRFQLLTAAWAIDKTNRVSMRTEGNAILVEYVDMIAHEQEQKESKKRQEKKLAAIKRSRRQQVLKR